MSGLDIRNLSDLLACIGFQLIEGVEFPAFTSSQIDSCITAAAAFEIGKTVRTAFKEAARIDPEFVLGSVIDYSTKPPRRHAFVEVESCAITISVKNPSITMSPPKGLSPGELARWEADNKEHGYQTSLERQLAKLHPAFFSSVGADVLKLLSIEQPTAETIYKIYELVEGHPKNRASFHQQFGISQNEFNRFKDAVHNPSVTGDWARHAYHDTPKTQNPMTKSEAEHFVRTIATKWLVTIR